MNEKFSMFINLFLILNMSSDFVIGVPTIVQSFSSRYTTLSVKSKAFPNLQGVRLSFAESFNN